MDLALAAAQMIRDQRPYEVQDGERINALDNAKVVRVVGFHGNALRAEGERKDVAMERARVRCYETTPYGRRFAKNNGVDTSQFGACMHIHLKIKEHIKLICRKLKQRSSARRRTDTSL